MLRLLANKSTLPWCILGDFNDLLYDTDKMGRHPHPNYFLEGFRQTIEDYALVEVDLTGEKVHMGA